MLNVEICPSAAVNRIGIALCINVAPETVEEVYKDPKIGPLINYFDCGG